MVLRLEDADIMKRFIPFMVVAVIAISLILKIGMQNIEASSYRNTPSANGNVYIEAAGEENGSNIIKEFLSYILNKYFKFDFDLDIETEIEDSVQDKEKEAESEVPREELETEGETEVEPEREAETEIPGKEAEIETPGKEAETETSTEAPDEKDEPETEAPTASPSEKAEPETETPAEVPSVDIETEIPTVEVEVQNPVNGIDEIVKDFSMYEKIASEESEWLWNQQLSNGAFAFYNEYNGSVYINPYFSEIVAISLINYDSSADAKERIEAYFDWHFAHINSATEDYNGVAGTIYDYDVQVKHGVVVSETSRGSYDSTDSYSALFIKALADYVKVYGDTSYIVAHKEEIKDIVNVMFATMSPNGYTYAKPDYQIIYLMDNAEVYAGLNAAEYIYENVISDNAMYSKVSKAVDFYNDNFNTHWWKGDHYAAVLNPDYSEYTGYCFSWDMFYPCATSQMFPIMYGIVAPDSVYAETLYDGLCNAWEWQDMDYVTEGVDSFCWGSFAYLGGLMEDEVRLNAYLDKYGDIVEGGRKYPLYSSESAMVLMGCMAMMK